MMKTSKTLSGWEASNHRRRKNNESDSSIDSSVHNQILKQQKQLNGKNHHTPVNINTECQWTELPHQKTLFDKLD
jgi:hypothetical protein